MVREFFELTRKYSFGFAFSMVLRKLWDYHFKENKFRFLILKIRQRAILNWLKKLLKEELIKYKSELPYKNQDINEKTKIWVFWWQGEKMAPDIIKSCIESIRKNSNNHEVIIISEDNVNEYLSFPDNIIKKVDKKIISLTHFSDILRVMILAEYGGIWADSTVFCTDEIGEEFFLNDFYSIKSDKKVRTPFVSEDKWSIFFMSAKKDNIIMKFVRDSLIKYWKTNDEVIDYFLTDYIIRLAYDNIKTVQNMIDSIKPNNEKKHLLYEVLNKKFNQKEYDSIINNNNIHKLSWKSEFVNNLENNEITYYGKLINGKENV